MKLHLFHFSLHGIVRALCQLRAGRALCKDAGVGLRPYVPASVNSMTPAWNFRLTLRDHALPRPRTIIDIGANVSQMTKLLKLSCEGEPTVLSFEPHPALTPVGSKYEIALSDADGEAEFLIPAGDSDWGTIKPRPGEKLKAMKVQKARFDSLVKNGTVSLEDLPGPILVKVDTEGSEFDALKGFGEHLKRVDYLLVEVENRDVRGGNYTFVELCDYLAGFGFDRSKVLYSCYDGPLAPSYLDTVFWRSR